MNQLNKPEAPSGMEHISSILLRALGQLFGAWEEQKKGEQIEKSNQAPSANAG